MNEKYAGTGQRDAYDLLTSLLQWLHRSLASVSTESTTVSFFLWLLPNVTMIIMIINVTKETYEPLRTEVQQTRGDHLTALYLS